MGIQFLNGNIFLYDHDVKFIISDIDGTITKSDILGHFCNLLGKPWFHDDIANLYNKIYNNGY